MEPCRFSRRGVLQSTLPSFDLLVFPVQVLFFLTQPALLGADFEPQSARVLFRVGQNTNGFFFGLQQDGLLFGLGAGACFRDGFFNLGQTLLAGGRLPLDDEIAQPDADCDGN